MSVEKRSRAPVALAAAVLLLGVMTIAALLMKPQSDQNVTSQATQEEPSERPNNDINTTRPSVIAVEDETAEQPVAPIDPS